MCSNVDLTGNYKGQGTQEINGLGSDKLLWSETLNFVDSERVGGLCGLIKGLKN